VEEGNRNEKDKKVQNGILAGLDCPGDAGRTCRAKEYEERSLRVTSRGRVGAGE